MDEKMRITLAGFGGELAPNKKLQETTETIKKHGTAVSTCCASLEKTVADALAAIESTAALLASREKLVKEAELALADREKKVSNREAAVGGVRMELATARTLQHAAEERESIARGQLEEARKERAMEHEKLLICRRENVQLSKELEAALKLQPGAVAVEA